MSCCSARPAPASPRPTAWLIEQVQRPTLVLAHNKTLAAQLATEFRELMPNNAVEYFVSYYDYYQPEAYVPQTDTFIEKDSSINAEVERLRHSTTNSLLSRRDVVVVSTVSCIYGLGTPEEYLGAMMPLQVGQHVDRDKLIRNFVSMQYERNDVDFSRGNVPGARRHDRDHPGLRRARHPHRDVRRRDRGALQRCIPLTGDVVEKLDAVPIFPASHYAASPDAMQRAIGTIRIELDERLAELERRASCSRRSGCACAPTFDLEMMEQIGFCNGIENYSRHIDGRAPGEAPNCLLDYFADDFLVVIDESHVTVPQIGAMYEGDASRKRTLVEHGFRLPSALDNRPLRWEEFLDRVGQKVYLSATPGRYELGIADGVVEQIIRPTGLVDPQIVVKPRKGQIDDLLEEIRIRAERDERVLVTTLTKKMAEELTDFLAEAGVRVRYLHSDVDTLRRVELLTELRAGVYDVLVGINLLREGLDLPEVSLVAILDADKEGFLRSSTSLIQTIGRAARNVSGEVHMYADILTDSMAAGDRRDHPPPREAGRVQPSERHRPAAAAQAHRRHHRGARTRRGRHGRAARRARRPQARRPCRTSVARASRAAGANELEALIADLNDQMLQAAGELKFELAARLRDELSDSSGNSGRWRPRDTCG